MVDTCFSDPDTEPDDRILAEALGKSYPVLECLRKHIRETHGETEEDWRFYGRKNGWQMKTLRKKRNLFFLIPGEDAFRIVFIFGDRAVAEIVKSGIDHRLKTRLLQAKKYAEGRGLSLTVRDGSSVFDIETLIGIKIGGGSGRERRGNLQPRPTAGE